MAAESRSSSSVRRRPSWAPNCDHGLPCDLLTSRTAANPGRRFFRCQARELDDCRFFEWVDFAPAANNYCRNSCMRILQLERDNYERLLHNKDETIRVLREKMKMKDEGNELLNGNLEEALETIEVYKKWGCISIAVVFVVVLYVMMFV